MSQNCISAVNFRKKLPEILARTAYAQETFEIVKHGKLLARLVPITEDKADGTQRSHEDYSISATEKERDT